MYYISSTIKIPADICEDIVTQVKNYGAEEVEVRDVSYDDFIKESRMYYDYVFEKMKYDKKPVKYICMKFDDTPEGRKQAYQIEYQLKLIPMNLRYEKI